jgi:hypothetical protein
MHAFLSHSNHDKQVARGLGAQLKLVGADVWFDEWDIRPGDSLPRQVDEGLATVDTVILLWSCHAHTSPWVGAELEASIARAMEDPSFRVIPVRLDDTPLPSLTGRLKWVELRDGNVSRAVNEIMGFANDQARLLAIQAVLDQASIEVAYFHGYGPVVCCPRCGAAIDRLRGWSQVDHSRDDTYAGFQCDDCGFNDGGEI